MGGPARIIAGGTTMEQLATNLALRVERRVFDKTGLSGRFEFNLAFTPDCMPGGAPPPGVPRSIPMARESSRRSRSSLASSWCRPKHRQTSSSSTASSVRLRISRGADGLAHPRRIRNLVEIEQERQRQSILPGRWTLNPVDVLSRLKSRSLSCLAPQTAKAAMAVSSFAEPPT